MPKGNGSMETLRFRYGLPEKIGGYEQITNNLLVGATENNMSADLDGRIYAAIGTNKALFVYYSGIFIITLLTQQKLVQL